MSHTPLIITFGGSVYPVRHDPLAIRLRDRMGRAILCVVLTPQNGGLLGYNTRSAFRRTPSRSYIRSMQPILQFARNFIRKSALPYCIFFPRIIMSKLLLCEEINTNRLKSIFSYKISRFTCVCAFFVVPLHQNKYNSIWKPIKQWKINTIVVICCILLILSR